MGVGQGANSCARWGRIRCVYSGGGGDELLGGFLTGTKHPGPRLGSCILDPALRGESRNVRRAWDFMVSGAMRGLRHRRGWFWGICGVGIGNRGLDLLRG